MSGWKCLGRAGMLSWPMPRAEPATLRRELGVLDATMIVVSGVIGGGIFFTPQVVAGSLPHGGWILAVWAAGLLIALAGALTFAELGVRFPDAGGHYVYIRRAFGGLPAFLYGWVLLLIIASGALASLALAFSAYLSAFVPMGEGAQKVLAVGTILLLSALNAVGVRPGGRTVTAITLLKIASLATLVGAGAWALMAAGRGSWEGALAPAEAGWPPESLPVAFGAALVPVLFSCGGWQQLNMVGGEVRDPARRIPLALSLGVAIVAAAYLGVNAVYLGALGAGGVAGSASVAADTADALFGPVGARLVTAAVALSILGIANVIILASPRVYFALAGEGIFLSELARVHPRFGTPARAIALQGAWASVLAVIGSIGALVNGVVFADWIFFGLGAASLFVIRRREKGTAPAPGEPPRERPGATPPAERGGPPPREGMRATVLADRRGAPPGEPRPFRTPGYPWVPGFFVAAAALAVTSAVVAYPAESLLGSGILLVGAGIYLWRRRPSGAAGV